MIDRLFARLGRAYAQMPTYFRFKFGMLLALTGGVFLMPIGMALGLPDALALAFGGALFVTLAGACLLFAKWRGGVSDEQFGQFWATVTTTNPDVEEEHYQFARQKWHVGLMLIGGCGGMLVVLLIGGAVAQLAGLAPLAGWLVLVLSVPGAVAGAILTARTLCRRYPDLPLEATLMRWARRIASRVRR